MARRGRNPTAAVRRIEEPDDLEPRGSASRRRQRGRVAGRNRQRALKGCCGSILDRRIDQVRRCDVISIVATVVAPGLRVLRAPAAGRSSVGGSSPPPHGQRRGRCAVAAEGRDRSSRQPLEAQRSTLSPGDGSFSMRKAAPVRSVLPASAGTESERIARARIRVLPHLRRPRARLLSPRSRHPELQHVLIGFQTACRRGSASPGGGSPPRVERRRAGQVAGRPTPWHLVGSTSRHALPESGLHRRASRQVQRLFFVRPWCVVVPSCRQDSGAVQ